MANHLPPVVPPRPFSPLAGFLSYLVPGLGTRVVADLDALVGSAWAIYSTARRLSSGARGGVAVVAWLDYPAPGLAQVPFDADAAVGGRRLASEVEGLRVSRGAEQPHVTVVGHSYGSLVAARAAGVQPGAVDELVVLGSPGVGADRAADVPVPDGHLWVGAASRTGFQSFRGAESAGRQGFRQAAGREA